MTGIRTQLTSSQRATLLKPTIDPGFVHHRKIQTILGPKGMEIIDDEIRKLPEIPDWQRSVRIDHIYTRVLLGCCNALEIKSLEENLATQWGPRQLFCSTEKLSPCPDVYDNERVISVWVPRRDFQYRVEFHYSTRHIYSDTTRSRLYSGEEFAIIAELSRFDEENGVIIFEPIIIGAPWLNDNNTHPDFDIMWYGFSFYEHFIEDFDEFAKVNEIPEPKNPEPMKSVSEAAFKTCLSEILGDATQGDWGGETSDYYTSHLHLQGRRVTAAFLLKGPSRFQPMNLNHLGKNNDQIVRLSHEPADVFIIQHCHDILSPVRETLRAFSVQPSKARRYCLIDGRDSLRLLQAYDLYEKAVEITKTKK